MAKTAFLYMKNFDAKFKEAQIVVPAPKSDTGWTNKNKNALKAIREIFTGKRFGGSKRVVEDEQIKTI